MARGIGQALKDARMKAGFSVSDVSEVLIKKGFKASRKTVYGWESGVSQPSPDALLEMCRLYGVKDILSEFGYSNNYSGVKVSSNSLDFSVSEIRMVESFRGLDTYGKDLIKMVLEREVKRCNEQAMESSEDAYIVIPAYPRIASAGNGMYLFNGIPSELVKVPRTRISEKADFILGVNGDSMEPTYRDGDRVYVRKTEELEPGEIGIFSQDGDCYIKELGDGVLISHNPNYKDIRMTDDLRCIGRVLGRVETA